jgi:hypothetical protein
MKGCFKELSYTYIKCNFHHICSKEDLDSLATQDFKILNKYTIAESIIHWCQDCKPGKILVKVQFKVETIKADSSSTKDKDIVEVICQMLMTPKL